jgi:hypothetical protein
MEPIKRYKNMDGMVEHYFTKVFMLATWFGIPTNELKIGLGQDTKPIVIALV